MKTRPFFGWYVLAACFIIGVMGIGARYSFGVFLKPLETEFNISRGTASSLFSIYMILCCIIAATGGWALDRFGPRKIGVWMAVLTGAGFLLTSRATAIWQLLVTYSLLLSLGTGTIYTVANSTASRWFHQKRGFAVGITSSGGGVGVVILAPLAAFLIARFDWRLAFVIMGVLIAAVMALASFWLVKDPQMMGLSPDGQTPQQDDRIQTRASSFTRMRSAEFSFNQAVRIKAFWLLLLTWLTFSLALHMVFVHVVPYAIDMGIDALDAAFIISLMGISNIPGRLLVGRLSDRLDRNFLGAVCVFLQFLAMIWLIKAHTLWMFYGFALCFGFFWGGTGTITTVLIGDIFGVKNLGSIMGVMSAAWAVGAALGPAIAGFLFDISGHYLAAFGVAAINLLAAVFLAFFARRPPGENCIV